MRDWASTALSALCRMDNLIPGAMPPELCCAEGAVSLLVRHGTDSPWRTWGNAPGFVVPKTTSAESAIHFLGEFDA